MSGLATQANYWELVPIIIRARRLRVLGWPREHANWLIPRSRNALTEEEQRIALEEAMREGPGSKRAFYPWDPMP